MHLSMRDDSISNGLERDAAKRAAAGIILPVFLKSCGASLEQVIALGKSLKRRRLLVDQSDQLLEDQSDDWED